MQLLSTITNLITIPSLSGDGKSCKKIISIARNALKSKKIKFKIIKANKKPVLIWGEVDLKKTEWLINAHLDVVPAAAEQFHPKINKGKIWGRGAADTKAGCAVMLENALSWDHLARTKHVTFMLVIDEEVGGESTKLLISQMTNIKGGIFLEPTGEKMIVQAKGIIQLKITAVGIAGHGSQPWECESALEKITSNLTRFRKSHPIPMRETRSTTFNFSSLTSGTAINQVPASAELWCDIRWSPLDNPKHIVEKIKKTFSNCTIETVKLESTVDCPKESLLRSSFTTSLKNSSINPIPGFEHGSSDARHCTALGIPALVFGPKGKNLHAQDEWVSIKSIKRVEQVLGHWIKNI
jgi:succinyl-diaminopimelate desuccinylase